MVDAAVIDITSDISIKQLDSKIKKLENEIFIIRRDIKKINKENISPNISIIKNFIEKRFFDEFSLFSSLCDNSDSDIHLLKNSLTVIYVDCARIIDFYKNYRNKWNELFNLSLNTNINLKDISNIHNKLLDIEKNFYFSKFLSYLDISDLFNNLKIVCESFDNNNLDQISTLVLYFKEINKIFINKQKVILDNFIKPIISISKNAEKIEKLVDSIDFRSDELKSLNKKKSEFIKSAA